MHSIPGPATQGREGLASVDKSWAHREGACILVHEAEGTDSTLLVTSLAQFILDPLSRTMAGFQELVEWEWIQVSGHPGPTLPLHPETPLPCAHRSAPSQASHPFQLHCVHSAFSHTCPKHKASTFLLFLYCAWQLGCQFLLSLEFGEGLLLALFGHANLPLWHLPLPIAKRRGELRGCQGRSWGRHRRVGYLLHQHLISLEDLSLSDEFLLGKI